MKKILTFFLMIVSMFSITSCNSAQVENRNDNSNISTNTGFSNELLSDENERKLTTNQMYQNFSKVDMTMEVIGTVERNIHTDVSSEGLERYPVYGKVLANATDDEKRKILAENDFIRASSSTYDSMDKDGNLYLNDVSADRKLYKHIASVGNYLGDVSDDEPAVVKKITIYPNKAGSYITGLYAPAGEVIKFEISQEDLEAIGGTYEVVIGQRQERKTGENNIWLARDFVRMPLLANTMSLKTETGYAGSYLGGPIYLDSIKHINRPITITISGAVEYHHFILGLTSEEDFARTEKSSAPFFELAVLDDMVRHNGPRAYAFKTNWEKLTYEDCYDVSILWANIAQTSRQFPNNSSYYASISFLYEPFVAAGAAVAFQGRNWCNLPMSWFNAALDYDAFVQQGSWGVIHEYNHHFQNYGLPNGVEVSNNATSLVSYALYTNISAHRSPNTEYNLYDWNRYTNASFVLRDINAIKGTNDTLSAYAALLHSFGADVFLKAAQLGSGGRNNPDYWYKAFSKASGYDMTYYFENMIHQNISESAKTEIQNLNLKPYIPAATIYQTGQMFTNLDGNLVSSNTMRPYRIQYQETVNMNFANDLVVPTGFDFTIKSFTQPTSGKVEQTRDKVLQFIPTDSQQSGKFYVTFTLENQEKTITQDVTLEFQFEQNRMGLEATTYSYDAKNMYRSVIIADSMNFKGYKDVSNYYLNNGVIHTLPANSVSTLEGKVYIDSTAKYRIGVKGDSQVLLYVSINNRDNYRLVAFVNSQLNSFNNSIKHSYEDYDLNIGDYVYFKLVTLSNASTNKGWGEIGLGKFNGDNVTMTSISKDKFYNVNLEHNDSKFNHITYFPIVYKENLFKSETNLQGATLVNYSGQEIWSNAHKLEYAFDGNPNTTFHSKTAPSAETPYSFTLKLNKEVNYNQIRIVGYSMANNAHVPTSFKVYAGNNVDNLQLIKTVTNATVTNSRIVNVNLDDYYNYDYIRFEISATNTNKYVAIEEIYLNCVYNLTSVSIDSNEIKYEADKWTVNNKVLAVFDHAMETESGSLTYKFTGNAFVIKSITGEKYGQFKVEIDGVEYLVDLSKTSSIMPEIVFLQDLDMKEHTVKITALGKINICSFQYQ